MYVSGQVDNLFFKRLYCQDTDIIILAMHPVSLPLGSGLSSMVPCKELTVSLFLR